MAKKSCLTSRRIPMVPWVPLWDIKWLLHCRGDPLRVKISVGQVGLVQLGEFVPVMYVAICKGHAQPYLISPVPELNCLDYS